jgi:hypothetical protein
MMKDKQAMKDGGLLYVLATLLAVPPNDGDQQAIWKPDGSSDAITRVVRGRYHERMRRG